MTMKKIMQRICSIIICLTVVSCSGIVSAFAVDDAESAYAVKTVYGHTYKYSSVIERWNSSQLAARTYVGVTSGKSVPIGYIGTKAKLYSTSGVLVASAGWSYNTVACWGHSAPVYHKTSETPKYTYYYSKGQIQLYNGSGYTTYNCYASPNMSSTVSSNIISVQRNSDGEIFGSEIFLNSIGVEPDLILALGTNGIEGYVRSADLDREYVPKNPTDALMHQEQAHEIPLYAEDGKSVLGSFAIQKNESDSSL